jgi:ABC-type transport system involved in multi-copper enzyme maturation permease subunit
MRHAGTLARMVWLETLRRKEVFVLFILLMTLLAWMAGMDVLGLSQVSGYVKDMGLLAAWVFGWILAITTAVRLLPQEEMRGTIFPLLAKPVTRLDVVAGKWLGAWSVVGAALLSFYLATWGVVLWRGGRFDPVTLLQAFLLHMAALAIVAALAVALSTRLNHDAAATLAYVLTGATFLILPRVPAFLTTERGAAGTALLALYYLLPHFELFDLRQRLVHDWGPAPWGIVAGVLLYGALMTAVLVLLAWIGFRRRRFTRGALL